jgi:F-type H+-transporting ATPase subunit a
MSQLPPDTVGEPLPADPARFDAGDVIIGHVANSDPEHPILHLPLVFGIDFSVSKHVLMLFIVATLLFFVITFTVRRYLRQDRMVPSGFMNLLEVVVLWVRDTIVAPNVGSKWVKAYTPLVLTFFLFIFTANAIGLVPLFDVLGLIDHVWWRTYTDEHHPVQLMLHGGPTATANVNVTAALASITFFSIIVAGARAHGFVQHWKNLVPSGVPVFVYPILIPIEILGMFVRPFALTMRLAANMTGGHIAILAIISFVFIFTELFGHWLAGIGVGFLLSLPIAVFISAIEIIIVIVQAYVFTLLTAVFMGMAIHAHH